MAKEARPCLGEIGLTDSFLIFNGFAINYESFPETTRFGRLHPSCTEGTTSAAAHLPINHYFNQEENFHSTSNPAEHDSVYTHTYTHREASRNSSRLQFVYLTFWESEVAYEDTGCLNKAALRIRNEI